MASLPGLAFKIMTDPFVGQLTFVRVYRGNLESVAMCITPPKTKKSAWEDSLKCILIREDIKEVYAGEICAFVGLKDTLTGDTLCDEKMRLF